MDLVIVVVCGIVWKVDTVESSVCIGVVCTSIRLVVPSVDDGVVVIRFTVEAVD